MHTNRPNPKLAAGIWDAAFMAQAAQGKSFSPTVTVNAETVKQARAAVAKHNGIPAWDNHELVGCIQMDQKAKNAFNRELRAVDHRLAELQRKGQKAELTAVLGNLENPPSTVLTAAVNSMLSGGMGPG